MGKNPEPGPIFENLVSIFWVKNTYSAMRIRIRDLDNSGTGIQDGKNRILEKHHGSAKLN
jgi:hypothetical protein